MNKKTNLSCIINTTVCLSTAVTTTAGDRPRRRPAGWHSIDCDYTRRNGYYNGRR